jgi:hypothetical protein
VPIAPSPARHRAAAGRAAAPLTAAVVDSILEQSRRNNPKAGITGILCFSDDLFVQVLEGGRDDVCELYNTIARAPSSPRISASAA